MLLFLLGGAVLVGEAVDRAAATRAGGTAAPELGAAPRPGARAARQRRGPRRSTRTALALYTYPFDTVGITALNRYVMEWFPADLGSLFGWLLARIRGRRRCFRPSSSAAVGSGPPTR